MICKVVKNKQNDSLFDFYYLDDYYYLLVIAAASAQEALKIIRENSLDG
jgi:hypothetical protein